MRAMAGLRRAAPARRSFLRAHGLRHMAASASAALAEPPPVLVPGACWTAADADGCRVRFAVSPDGASSLRLHCGTHRYTELPSGRRLINVCKTIKTPIARPGGTRGAIRGDFDEPAVAARVAATRGVDTEIVLREWAHRRNFGHGFHASVYRNLTGEVSPETEHVQYWEEHGDQRYEDAFRSYIDTFLNGRGYTVCPQYVEMMVWARGRGLAGTVDCVLHCPEGNASICSTPHLLLLDWKTGASSLQSRTGFRNMGWPFDALEDTAMNSYAAQLNMYRVLLIEGGWVPQGMEVVMGVVNFWSDADGAVQQEGMLVSDLGSRVSTFMDLFADPPDD